MLLLIFTKKSVHLSFYWKASWNVVRWGFCTSRGVCHFVASCRPHGTHHRRLRLQDRRRPRQTWRHGERPCAEKGHSKQDSRPSQWGNRHTYYFYVDSVFLSSCVAAGWCRVSMLQSPGTSDEQKREQMEFLIREELERWDSESTAMSSPGSRRSVSWMT